MREKLPIELLKVLFAFAVVIRFIYPFWHNPIDFLFSDPARHWENGLLFFNPSFFGSAEPKMYQIFLYLVNLISGDDKVLIALCTGLLCASVPFMWYRVFRQLLSKKTSYILAILVAIHPSFLAFFGYFMNINLFLLIFPLALYLTFRAQKKKTLKTALWAVFVWLLAVQTRSIAVPFALASLIWIFINSEHKKQFVKFSLIIAALIAVPSAFHSHKQLNIYAPFGFNYYNEIYAPSMHEQFSFTLDDGAYYIFASSSFYTNVYSPFDKYKSHRKKDAYHFVIDRNKGREDWLNEIDKVREKMTFSDYWENLKENFIFLNLSPSWPDSSSTSNYILERWNYHLRWVLPFLIIPLMLMIPFLRFAEAQAFIIGSLWLVLIYMVIQNQGIVEGRYRKPLEPLLFMAVPMVFGAWKSKKNSQRLTIFGHANILLFKPCLLYVYSRLSWKNI